MADHPLCFRATVFITSKQLSARRERGREIVRDGDRERERERQESEEAESTGKCSFIPSDVNGFTVCNNDWLMWAFILDVCSVLIRFAWRLVLWHGGLLVVLIIQFININDGNVFRFIFSKLCKLEWTPFMYTPSMVFNSPTSSNQNGCIIYCNLVG